MIQDPVLCVGPQKSGTHALVKGVELLGFPRDDEMRGGFCALTHCLPSEAPANSRAIFITRNPRNMLVSLIRWRKQQLASGYMIGAITSFGDGLGMHDYMMARAGWLQSAHVVRFEDLVSSEAALIGIAAYLGVPYLADAYAALPGATLTWSGQLSDWASVWTQEIEDAWVAAGMPAVESTYGYL